jgi:hypothetical protein
MWIGCKYLYMTVTSMLESTVAGAMDPFQTQKYPTDVFAGKGKVVAKVHPKRCLNAAQLIERVSPMYGSQVWQPQAMSTARMPHHKPIQKRACFLLTYYTGESSPNSWSVNARQLLLRHRIARLNT